MKGPRQQSKPKGSIRVAVRQLQCYEKDNSFEKNGTRWMRTERVKRRRVVFHSPEQLIREAGKLVPEYRPRAIRIMGDSDNRCCSLTLEYGWEEMKLLEVCVRLTFEEAHLLRRHLERASPKVSVCHQVLIVRADPPIDGDDDGGEELPVPKRWLPIDLETAEVPATLQ